MVLGLLLLLAKVGIASAAYQDLLRSVVQIRTSQESIKTNEAGVESKSTSYKIGTGFFYKVDKDKEVVYIMTAGHVIGHRKQTIEVRTFWQDSSRWIGAKAHKVVYDKNVVGMDGAILTIPIDKFPSYSKTIKWKKKREPVKINKVLITYGYPGGQWPSLIVAKIFSVRDDGLLIRPAGKPGRSGSPIMDEKANIVLGILVRSNLKMGYSIILRIAPLVELLQSAPVVQV